MSKLEKYKVKAEINKETKDIIFYIDPVGKIVFENISIKDLPKDNDFFESVYQIISNFVVKKMEKE